MTKSKSMRKLLACIVAVMIALAYMPAAVQGAYAMSGTGSEEDPIKIESAADLVEVATNINDGSSSSEGVYYELTGDIDLGNGGTSWVAIGTDTFPFAGNFNGAGYSISGLEGSQGLFGHVDGASISNVLVYGTATSTSSNVAGIVGCVCASAGTTVETVIKNVGNFVNVTATGTTGVNVAGIIGNVNGGETATVSNCFNKATITGYEYAGGIVGRNQGTLTIVSSYNEGNVTATHNDLAQNTNAFAGGICGNACTVNNSYSTGKVIGYRRGGGFGSTTQQRGYGIASGAPTVSGTYWLAGSAERGNGNDTLPATSQTQFTDGTVLGGLNSGDYAGKWIDGYKVKVKTGTAPQVYPGLAWEIMDIDDLKTATISKLENYVDPNDYGEFQQWALEEALIEGRAAINSAANEQGIDAALNDAIMAINDIPTLVEIDNAKGELDQYKGIHGPYDDPQDEEINEIIAEFKNLLDNAVTDQQLQALLNEALTAMAQIPNATQVAEADAAKAMLRQAVIYAKEILGAGEFTEDTVGAVNKALDDADKIMKDPDAFATDVEKAIDEVYDALYNLEPIDKNAEKKAEEIEKELKERIAAVEALVNKLIDIYTNVDEADYTPESYAPLQEAIDAAEELLSGSALPGIVDYEMATANLLFAQKDLVKKPAGLAELKDQLGQKVIDAKRDIASGDYTEDSVANLTKAIDDAKAIIENVEATEADVIEAYTDLMLAWYDLEPIDKAAEKEIDAFIAAYAALCETLNDVKDIKEADYTAETYADLKAAVDDANALLEDPFATSNDLTAAKIDILVAQKDLVKKPAGLAELKDQLGQKVIDAKRDIASGDYTEDSVANLTKAIVDARAIIENVEATEADVIKAYTDLMLAWYDLEPIDKAAEKEIDDYIAASAALYEKLIDVENNIKKADYTAGTYAKLKSAVDEANALLKDPFATSNDLIVAKIDILVAQKDLKKKSTNTMTVKTKKKTVGYKAVKSKKTVVKAITVTKAKGKVTYAKTAGSAKLTVNKQSGKITVKKGTKKGTYKAKVKVKAAGDDNYKAKTQTVQVVIVVK